MKKIMSTILVSMLSINTYAQTKNFSDIKVVANIESGCFLNMNDITLPPKTILSVVNENSR